MFKRAVANAPPPPQPTSKPQPSKGTNFSQSSLLDTKSSRSTAHGSPTRTVVTSRTTTTSTSISGFVTVQKKRPAESETGNIRKVLGSTSNFSESKLEGVFIDENDFDDDDDLNFDESYIIPTPAPTPGTAAAPAVTTAARGVAQPMSDIPSSSAPIPWPSSPPPPPPPEPPVTEFSEEKKTTRRRLPASWNAKVDRDEIPLIDLSEEKEVKPRRLGVNRSVDPWEYSSTSAKEKARKAKAAMPKNEVLSKNGKKKGSNDDEKSVTLSDEQRAILDLIVESQKSVFFTGSAGTGKSVLMREVIKALKIKYRSQGPDRVAVTASTGLAACNIGGNTLHSFAGIGLGKEPAKELLKKIKKNAKNRNRWMRTKVLIIDEISMVDGELFDKLEEIARTMINKGVPFGGIQLVVTGDFFQLPPVAGNGQQAKFAFESEAWGKCIDYTIKLEQVFRQRDEKFAAMLNEMRLGKLSQESINEFRKLSRPLPIEQGLEATELYPMRHEVERSNVAKMNALPGTTEVFDAEDGGTIENVEQRKKLLSNCMAPEKIVLKHGAQVLLLKNIDEQLVNGSQGKVLGFLTEKQYESFFDEFGNMNEFRLQSLKNPAGLVAFASRYNPDGPAERKWPLVEFPIPGGGQRYKLCTREEWKYENPNGEVIAFRRQIPLILAWALSIHKAQGQTLERVRVDLSRIFEKGQAYVALSRATTREGLEIRGFDPRKVMAHPKVIQFYANLDSAQKALDMVSGKEKKKGGGRGRSGVFDDEDDYGESEYHEWL